MRKTLFLGLLILGLSIYQVNAQSNYKTALGLTVDFGDGATEVGPSVKHFFAPNHAGQFEVLFGNHHTVIEAFYQYHKQIPNAEGLQWYLGIGPGVSLYDNGSNFLLRPTGGLDYKISNVPLDFHFDWRPTIVFYDNDTDFEPARFSLGFRYAF
ncbi:MAG: hypothetical protein ABWZ25_06800 [Chitinophagaceae bacterium]